MGKARRINRRFLRQLLRNRRLPRSPRPATGGRRQHQRPRGQPLPRRIIPQGAQTGALLGGVAVGGIFHPIQPHRPQIGAQTAGWDAQQGPQTAQQGGLDQRGHPGKPSLRTARQQAHTDCLGLISGVMAKNQMQNAPPPTFCRQRRMPGMAGAGGDAGAGGKVGEGENIPGDPKAGQSGHGGLGLGAGFRAQTVIDDQRQDVAALIAHPVPHQQRGGQTIRPTRDRDGHMRQWLERPERGDQAGKFCRGNRQGWLKAQWQPAALRAAAA